MRIGIFTNNFTPIVSGVTNSVENFREGLNKSGHEVFVFAPNFPGYKDKDDHIFRYPSAPIKYKAKYPIPMPSGRVLNFVKKTKLDLIHSQHPWAIGSSALKIARKLNIPIIFTNHTRYEYYVDYVPPLLPRKLLIKIVEKAATRYANKVDAVIVPTPSIEQYLRENGVKKPIYVNPSGIDFSELNASPDVNLRKKYNIPEKDKIIINISRIGPEKNLPRILEAFKIILDENSANTLVMVGGGPFLKELKATAKDLKIENKVIFTDLIQFEEVGGYLKGADVFIHASLSETQGLVMLEAMAMNLPVIAVGASAVTDIVKSNVNGDIAKDTPKSLADACLKVLSNEKLMIKLSKGALVTAKEYKKEKTTEGLLKIYKKII